MAKSAIDVKKVPYVRTVCEFDKGGKFDQIRFESEKGIIVWDLATFSKENCRHAMVQAFRSKGADEYAGHAQDFPFVQRVLGEMEERMQSEFWNVGRSESFGGTSDLFQAVVNTNKEPITYEQVEAAWDELDDAGKRMWRGNEVFQAEKLEIQLLRAKAKAADAEPIEIKIGK